MKNTLNESPRAESSASCRYYCETECRFLSPVTLDGKVALFPPMVATDWCGRWKNRGSRAPNAVPWVQRIAKPATRPRIDWQFIRGVLCALAPSPDKAQGYNVLHRVANDQADISKASFNVILQQGIDCGELRRNDTTGRFWV